MTTLLPRQYDMYDAIPSLIHNIPQNPFAVAGYVDSYSYTWSQNDWNLFPNSLHCTISTSGRVRARFYDCENGDLTVQQGHDHVVNDRLAGWESGIYCTLSNWQAAQDTFANERQPPYWIAHADGVRELPVLNGITADAKQYDFAGIYDVSCLSDTFVNLIGSLDMNLSDTFSYTSRTDGQQHTARVEDALGAAFDLYVQYTQGYTGLGPAGPGFLRLAEGEDAANATLAQVQSALADLAAKVDALATTVASLSKPSGSGTITGSFTVG